MKILWKVFLIVVLMIFVGVSCQEAFYDEDGDEYADVEGIYIRTEKGGKIENVIAIDDEWYVMKFLCEDTTDTLSTGDVIVIDTLTIYEGDPMIIDVYGMTVPTNKKSKDIPNDIAENLSTNYGMNILY